MSGCRWNMVSMGFWSPTEWGHGEPPGLATCLHPPAPGPALTKIRLLQENLREGPANATDERGPQHQGKALHVELRGLVGEHEEAPGDEEDHEDQRRPLGGGEQAAAHWGVSRSSHLEFGGRQPPWLALLSPPTTLGGPGQLLPMEGCRAASSWLVPNTPTCPPH